MTTYTQFVAQRNGVTEPGLSAKTIEELQQLIKEKFTYKSTMLPENVIYWENYKKSLTFAKVTTIVETI